MKKILMGLALLIGIPLYAQQADEQIGTYINANDWFGLEANYPALKSSMQHDFLKLLAESMIYKHFNRTDEAIESIQTLLRDHQAEIGGGNAFNLAMLLCELEDVRGNYATAAQQTQELLDQAIAMNVPPHIIDNLNKMLQIYKPFVDTPAPRVVRSQEDVVIPIQLEKVKLPTSIDPKGWRGTDIKIPVQVNGKTYSFIFDTGAGTTSVSSKMAQELGVRILSDSLKINSIESATIMGQRGTLDSMQIGSMTFHHPQITIIPPNKTDSILTVDAILGMDFIRLFDEFRIYPAKKEIVFPAISSPLPTSGRNLMFSDQRIPMLKVTKENEDLIFVFDTGCTTALLSVAYYNEHKDSLDAIGQKDTQISGGVNVIETKNILRLPSFPFRVGNTPVDLKDLIVDITPTESESWTESGILGMSLINEFECVTINLKEMFLKLE